jgi:hypothetical protein
MPRKKSVKHSAREFRHAVDEIMTFLGDVSKGQTCEHVSWLHDYGIIRLYREFESLVLDALVGAINNDTSTVSSTTRVRFPKHLSAETCEFVVTGIGYFDFKGRPGLIKTLKEFVPKEHYIVTTIKKDAYKAALEQLSALRNFAAHGSDQSKRVALEAIGGKRIASSGAWLKGDTRFHKIADGLKALSEELENAAPY